jgi:hypothetical protein
MYTYIYITKKIAALCAEMDRKIPQNSGKVGICALARQVCGREEPADFIGFF